MGDKVYQARVRHRVTPPSPLPPAPAPSPQPQMEYSQAVHDVIGYKGSPRSIADIVSSKVVNPNFSKGVEWRINCQRCIVAAELQRRGYDVEALPNTGNDKFSKWYAAFKNVNLEVVGYALRLRHRRVTGKMAIDAVATAVTNWGIGSRGVLYVKWKGGNAHVMNVECVRDPASGRAGVLAYDAQDGSYVDLNTLTGDVVPDSVMTYRTDNLEPNEKEIGYFVKKRGT